LSEKHSSQSESDEAAFLNGLAHRVRSARAARGMTRRILSRDSGVSERYLAQLEAGKGNVSVLVLLRIAEAMAMPVDLLLRDDVEVSSERGEAEELLRQLDGNALREALTWLGSKASQGRPDRRARRIGLIGLRGGGKSALGKVLAEALELPFIELNRVIEAEYGGSLDDLFSLAGQPAYRRYENRCLERVLAENKEAVIATGGGIVANDEAFGALLDRTHTIWIQASPEEHMARVVAQGDLRPMVDNREAMRDLRQILTAREGAYGRADAQLDTSGRTLAQSAGKLVELAKRLLDKSLAVTET
tara:strand:+ start:496 stop:1407 length:912 start_codon:yes stop_codon:yes gene_type:complete